MKTYKMTLKYDNGMFNILTTARDKEQAIKAVCAAEGCPERAIIKITILKNQ